MRRTRLARAALATALLSIPVAGLIAVPSGAASAATLTAGPKSGAAQEVTAWKASKAPSFNAQVASYVKRFEGVPYRYGGASPSGFDCSGLTQYVYRHFHKTIARTADAQFHQFKRISKAQAIPGDLVFFHESSNPGSYVYHVGVYEGGQNMVAAPSSGKRVSLQSFAWAGNTVTFGTISH